MKTIASIFFFLILTSQNIVSQNWQQLTDFPGPARDDGSVFTIGNHIYCGTGGALGIGASSDFYRFDPLTDTWDTYTVTALPGTGRQYCSSFSYAGYGYIVGGLDPSFQASNLLYRYDTLTNSWVQKTSLPDSIQGAVCFFINDKAYICGGRDVHNTCTSRVWEYDPIADSWIRKNNMPENGRWRASGAVINNKGYLLFGVDSLNKFSRKLFEYDPVNDTWNVLDSFPVQGRAYASIFSVNNQLVTAFGIDSNNAVYSDCHSFDVSTHQWQTLNALPSFGRKGCMAFTYNNAVYITTGIDGQSNRLKETWKSDNITGIKKMPDFSDDIKVFPNPSKGFVTVSANLSGQDRQLNILTLSGEKIFSASLEKGSTNKKINLQGLAIGTYLLQIQTGNELSIKKIIIEH